jgi:hypothetical protein
MAHIATVSRLKKEAPELREGDKRGKKEGIKEVGRKQIHIFLIKRGNFKSFDVLTSIIRRFTVYDWCR